MRPERAFTLVELLVVIAVIAILAAILFPIFGTVREKTRQATCMSNLMQLTQATRQFHLDRDRYPEHLFGPAYCPDGDIPPDPPPPGHVNVSMAWVAAKAMAGEREPQYRQWRRAFQESLWPVYIRDLSIYHCPNNTVFSRADADAGTTGNQMPHLWKARAGSRHYPTWTRLPMYRYDSYDVSPPMDLETGKLDLHNNFLPRYARHWYPYNGATPPPEVSEENYRRQLVWREVEDDTYLTMCVYHAASNGMVPIAFVGGSVKVVPLATLKKMPDLGDRYRIPLPTKDARYWEFKP